MAQSLAVCHMGLVCLSQTLCLGLKRKGAWSRFKVGFPCLFQVSQELSKPQFSHLQNGLMRTVSLTESLGGFAETQDSLAQGKGSGDVLCCQMAARWGGGPSK